MRLGLISDTHIGITKEKVLVRRFKELAEQNIDVLCHSGDFCGSHIAYPDVEKTCKIMRDALPDTPIFATIGNHDKWCDYHSNIDEYNGNYYRITESFKSHKIHFLDEDGAFRLEKFPGYVFFGCMGWYQNRTDSNDYDHMPKGIEGDTFSYLYKKAYKDLDKAIAQLKDDDVCRIFVSHFPVINPGPWGWSEKIGQMLEKDFHVQYFLNGHSHELHEGPLRYESGSDYTNPKWILIDI